MARTANVHRNGSWPATAVPPGRTDNAGLVEFILKFYAVRAHGPTNLVHHQFRIRRIRHCCHTGLLYSVLYYRVHATWLLATLSGSLSLCNPYWADCHSISATGRYFPASVVFKALFIPIAVLMQGYWLLLHHWLVTIGIGRNKPLLITALGSMACIALIAYTVTLGVEQGPSALVRRLGAVIYFAFTSFAHLLLLSALRNENTVAHMIAKERYALSVTCMLLIAGAILSALIGFVWQGWSAWDNAFEWAYALVMISLFGWVARMWKRTGYSVHSSVNGSRF